MSDNLDAFPVHRIEGTALGALGTIPPDSNLYTDQQIYQFGIHGPFLQTLFLGCSVVNFNVNLGWGSDASSLSVSLVEDTSNHWLSDQSRTNNALIDTIITTPTNINSQTFYSYTPSNKYPNTIKPDQSVDGVGQVRPESGADPNRSSTINKELHKNILVKEQIKYNEALQDNTNRAQGTPPRPDYGKVYYEIKYDGTFIRHYWKGPDPGFVGESYDILGTPVRFIFNDFEFTGIVTSWKNNGGSGGKNLYTVEIKSFASLLKNTQLIIDHYSGSIFRRMPGSPPTPFSNTNFGLPSNNIGDRLGKYNSTDFNNSDYNQSDFVGNVIDGNIPNVFNVYGYLQSVAGWGKHNIDERGTLVSDILVAMSDLINKSATTQLEADLPDTPLIIDARYSPYGRIIGKSPALTKQSVVDDTTQNNRYTVRFLKDQYLTVNPYNTPFLRLKETELPEGSIPSLIQSLEPVVFQGDTINLNKMGLLPAYTAVDQQIRQQYTINFSGLPPVPSGYRVQGPVISILDLVQNICDINNYDFFIDFQPQRNAIQIRTVSRQNQPPNNYINQLIKDSSARDQVTSYDYGLEFNDQATIRSLYIGPKQQRLLQLSSNLLSRKNNGLIFDPKEGTMIDHDLSNIKNVLRSPDPFCIRQTAYPYYSQLNNIPPDQGFGTGAIIFEPDNDIGGDRWNWGANVGRGNYGENITYNFNSEYLNFKNESEDVFADKAKLLFIDGLDEPIEEGDPMEEGGDVDTNNEQIRISYPIWDDFICPYFGTHPDGTIRKVYYDSAMQQLQVICSVTDIQNILGYALTKELNLNTTTSKQDDTVNGQPRLPYDAVTSYDPNALSDILNNPSNTASQMAANTIGSNDRIDTFHTQWNVESREFYDNDSKFVLLENEIRAAMGGFDSWIYYTFNKTFTTDLGRMLRLSMVTPSGNIITESSPDDPATKAINENEPVVTMVFHGPDPHIIGDVSADSPTSSNTILNDKVSDMLQKVHAYVKNIGDTYYGKQFMVKVPGLSISRDKPITSTRDFTITYADLSFDIKSYNGAGKLYSNYKPAKDGAWEEPGNIIDDTIIIGSITGDLLSNDDGRFGAILGYNGSYEYLNDTIPDVTIQNATKPASSASYAAGPGLSFVDNDNNRTNYASFDNIGSPAGFSTTDLANGMLTNVSPSPDDGNEPNTNPPTMAMILAQASQPATGIGIIPNEWYPSLVTSLPNSEYLYYPYNFSQYPNITELSSFTFADMTDTAFSAYDKPIPENRTELASHLRYKVYAKADILENFLFIRTDNFALGIELSTTTPPSPNYREPRAIISIGSPMECNPVHLASKYVHHCFLLDSSIFKLRPPTIPEEVRLPGIEGTIVGGLVSFSGGFAASASVITNATDHFLDALNAIDKDSNRAVTMPIAPKAAMPGFAAVPLQTQCAVYGPWTNHPWLVRKDIFTDPDISQNEAFLRNAVNNLVGGLKVEVVDELCPWNFGGMKNLDMEAIARLESDASYQISQEYGNISIPGSPIYKLGDFLDLTSQYTSGPVINSIRTNISDGGVSTEYTLRTFTRKFGLFNKENANTAAKISSESLNRRKQIAIQAAEVSNRRISNLRSETLNNVPKKDFVNPPIAETWRSSSELLVGHNDVALRIPLSYRSGPQPDIQGGIQHISGLVDYDASWGFAPRWKTGDGYNVLEYPKIFSNTQVMDSREAVAHLQGNYENTSFMSLDGLLSPISFYPTENFRTYHITKYPRRACRYCYGKGKLDYSSSMAGLANSVNATRISENNSDNSQASTRTVIECPFCEKEVSKVDQLIAGSSRGQVMPPFILTSGTDSLDSDEGLGTTDALVVRKTAGTVINYSTLNPAVIAYGEFSNFQNRQTGDLTGHSIRMVGHSTIPPNMNADSLNQMHCGDNRLFKTNLDFDVLYLDKINQLRSIPPEKRTQNINKILQGLPQTIRPFSNNARFFGFRGPMMLHGWGYDTEGYPVPNASGELKYDSNFNPIKATGIDDPSYVVNVYKNQEFIPVSEETQNNLDPNIQLVTGPNGQAGYWTEPKKETKFAKGWAQTPSIWPVGPIDLRWDHKAKVWTMPSTFKNVYVLLEEDLNDNIARGELIDNGQDIDDRLKPLGYRKVVYVRDTMGIYAAPRSAIVYCGYNEDGGFYEPISQSTFNTSGTIVSSTTASLYKIFQRSIASLDNSITSNNEPATYTAVYSNPLGLNANPGDLAIFTFMKNGWIVQAGRG